MKFYSEINDGGEVVAVWQIGEEGDGDYRLVYRVSLEVRSRFQLSSNGQLFPVRHWTKKMSSEASELWEKREQFPKIVATEKKGQGYSGGHNTAARLGWSTWTPEPVPGCIMHLDTSRQGRFTGYSPSMRSYERADVAC